jgi:hypothetical protein
VKPVGSAVACLVLASCSASGVEVVANGHTESTASLPFGAPSDPYGYGLNETLRFCATGAMQEAAQVERWNIVISDVEGMARDALQSHGSDNRDAIEEILDRVEGLGAAPLGATIACRERLPGIVEAELIRTLDGIAPGIAQLAR